MNNNAIKLQMMSTNFDSPHGLMNPQNYSSAYDMGKLAGQCMKNEYFRKIVTTQVFECEGRPKDGEARQFRWENTNKLLAIDGYIGTKTGITDAAGPCLIATYQKG
jgi:D-alanyl-D-alanine carboxypeptidase